MAYRPATLDAVSSDLDKLDPMQLGVGTKFRETIEKGSYKKYRVQKNDGLRAITASANSGQPPILLMLRPEGARDRARP